MRHLLLVMRIRFYRWVLLLVPCQAVISPQTINFFSPRSSDAYPSSCGIERYNGLGTQSQPFSTLHWDQNDATPSQHTYLFFPVNAPELTSPVKMNEYSTKRKSPCQDNVPNLDLSLRLSSHSQHELPAVGPETKRMKLHSTQDVRSFATLGLIGSSSTFSPDAPGPSSAHTATTSQNIDRNTHLANSFLSLHPVQPQIHEAQDMFTSSFIHRQLEQKQRQAQHPELNYYHLSNHGHRSKRPHVQMPTPVSRKNVHHKTFKIFAQQRSRKDVEGMSVEKTFRPNDQKVPQFLSIPSFHKLFGINDKSIIPRFQYTLVEYKPSTMDGKIVLEAINRCKLKNGDKLFNIPTTHTYPQPMVDINLLDFHQLMFCLQPSFTTGGNSFFDLFDKLDFYRRKPTKAPELTEGEGSKNKVVFRELVRPLLFKLTRKHHRQDKAHSSYRRFVEPDFDELFSRLQKAHLPDASDRNTYRQAHRKLTIAKDILSLYLLYVDMISAILPIRKLDNDGQLLRSQRKEAGDFYFEIAEYCLFNKLQEGSKNKVDTNVLFLLREKYQNKDLLQTPNLGRFIWDVLHSWIQSERKQLQIFNDKKSANRFKQFFNCLMSSLINSPIFSTCDS